VSFDNIKGQDRAIEYLKAAIANGRVGHAYIFFGPQGVGKRLSATNFAKALNCAGSSRDLPCDECISCKKIDSLNHPDFVVLSPEKDSASIKIDAVRELARDISLKPYEARKKVYVIDDAALMKHEAQNALLKTLEEPVTDSVLMLVTSDISRLFSTIRSRAQEVRFFPLTADEVKEALVGAYGVEKTRACILAHISGGTLGGALKYNNEELFEKRSRIIDAIDRKTLFEWDFEGVSRTELKMYLDIILTWYRDILVAKTGSMPAGGFVNIDKKDAILRQAREIECGRIDDIIKEVISTASFLDRNANPKLAMSVLGLNLA
jgi:DNA polymerase-3 subunit delta'